MAAIGRCAHRSALFTIGLAAVLTLFTLTPGAVAGSSPRATSMSKPPEATKQLGGWDHKKIGMALGVVGGLVLAVTVLASVSGRRRLATAQVDATSRGAQDEARPAPHSASPAMVFCGRCGTRLSREFRFCSQCGRELRLPPSESSP